MNNKEINLLPDDRQKALANAYWVRFGTVVIMVTTGLVLAAGLLLIPSYVFLNINIDIKQRDLARIEEILASSDEKELLTRLKAFEAEATKLSDLESSSLATKTITSILSVPHNEVSLSGFSYVSAAGKAPRQIIVSGVADSREALHQYQVVLKELEKVTSAELPVSTYTKDSNIPFSITVSFLP